MEIKIIYVDGRKVIMHVNDTIEEIGEKYFADKQVVSVEILSGGVNDTDYFVQTPVEIYRVSEEEIREFDLWHNIRYRYRMHSKIGAFPDYNSSCGLCNVA